MGQASAIILQNLHFFSWSFASFALFPPNFWQLMSMIKFNSNYFSWPMDEINRMFFTVTHQWNWQFLFDKLLINFLIFLFFFLDIDSQNLLYFLNNQLTSDNHSHFFFLFQRPTDEFYDYYFISQNDEIRNYLPISD